MCAVKSNQYGQWMLWRHFNCDFISHRSESTLRYDSAVINDATTVPALDSSAIRQISRCQFEVCHSSHLAHTVHRSPFQSFTSIFNLANFQIEIVTAARKHVIVLCSDNWTFWLWHHSQKVILWKVGSSIVGAEVSNILLFFLPCFSSLFSFFFMFAYFSACLFRCQLINDE